MSLSSRAQMMRTGPAKVCCWSAQASSSFRLGTLRRYVAADLAVVAQQPAGQPGCVVVAGRRSGFPSCALPQLADLCAKSERGFDGLDCVRVAQLAGGDL